MTSERQILANRRNGALSRGPKTRAGKARSSRNALRHGLFVPAGRDPDLAAAIDGLARVLLGSREAHDMDEARRAAEAEVDLERVRAARVALIEQMAARTPADDAEETAELLARTLFRLEKLDRYERRARWNRARAEIARRRAQCMHDHLL